MSWIKRLIQGAVMLRRLYFMFPSVSKAQDAVGELAVVNGIPRQKIHTIAGQGVEPGDLPGATVNQRHDLRAQFAWWFWGSELALFVMAFLGLLVALYFDQIFLAILAALVMLVTFQRCVVYHPRAGYLVA
jgi:hypothetical protein